jgi:hypothetical protein
MKWLLFILSGILLFLACDKTEDGELSLNGRYLGSFNRTGMDTVQVSVLFRDNYFEGQSDRTNYPAICRGSFQTDDNTITFTDSCAWTANFDWSLILSGTYNASLIDGTLRIWKNNGAVTDEYVLRPVMRQ